MKRPYMKTMMIALPALLLLAACGSDDDAPSAYAVAPQTQAPAWSVDWQSDEARPDWQAPAATAYENWAVALVQIEPELARYASDDDLLALFVAGELRGLAEPAFERGTAEADDNNLFVLKVYGNESNQNQVEVTAKYYNARLKQTFTRTTRQTYTIGGIYGVDEEIMPLFTLGSAKYPVVMSLGGSDLTSRLSPLTSQMATAQGDIIAAFVGDECRGKTTLAAPLSAADTLTVYGREAGEAVTLKYYSATGQCVYTLSATVALTANMTSN